MSLLLESGLFDTVAGLPVHPLVVHAAVILLPISAIALIVIYFVPRWRKQYGWLTMIAMAAGAAAGVVAKESGEALAARVGLPAQHQQLADVLVPVAVVTLVVSAIWFWLQRRADASDTTSVAAKVVGGLAVALSLAVVVLTVMVGHAGATAAWADRITPAQPSAVASVSGAVNPVASGSTAAPTKSFTMAEVRQHASRASCWAVVDGKVYDLTSWISRHPGGPDRILGLCGTDGTAAFTQQHSTQTRPNEMLASFYLGTLR